MPRNLQKDCQLSNIKEKALEIAVFSCPNSQEIPNGRLPSAYSTSSTRSRCVHRVKRPKRMHRR
jgi:hypothetical protein